MLAALSIIFIATGIAFMYVGIINRNVSMSTAIQIYYNCPFYKRECEECRHWDEEKMECEMTILQDRKI